MHKVKKILIFQCVITVVIALLSLGWRFQWIEAYSALLGGIVSIFPTLLFATVLFYHQGARKAKNIANNFYRGEALKIALSILLFVVVYKYFAVNPLIFIMTYSVVSTLSWFCALYSEIKVKVIK